MSLAATSRRSQVRPPAKGSFPLDRQKECKKQQDDYLQCLRFARKDGGEAIGNTGHQVLAGGVAQYDHLSCRGLAKLYLQCRMDKQLMSVESMKSLGFCPEEGMDNTMQAHDFSDVAACGMETDRNEDQKSRKNEEKLSKEDVGFVAGVQALRPYTQRGILGRLVSRFNWTKSYTSGWSFSKLPGSESSGSELSADSSGTGRSSNRDLESGNSGSDSNFGSAESLVGWEGSETSPSSHSDE